MIKQNEDRPGPSQRGRIKAAGGKFKCRANLCPRDVELADDFLYGGSGFEVFEYLGLIHRLKWYILCGFGRYRSQPGHFASPAYAIQARRFQSEAFPAVPVRAHDDLQATRRPSQYFFYDKRRLNRAERLASSSGILSVLLPKFVPALRPCYPQGVMDELLTCIAARKATPPTR